MKGELFLILCVETGNTVHYSGDLKDFASRAETVDN